MNITYKKEVTEKVTIEELEYIIEEIYEEGKSNTIYFNFGENEKYINFTFDDYVSDGYASTYIELNNTYFRIERNHESIINIIKNEKIF